MIRTMTYLILGLCLTSVSGQGAKRIDPWEAMKKSFPDSSGSYSWRSAASMIHSLSKDDVRRLAKENVLISDEAYKQVFEPYNETYIPFFITSDAVLFAFHVLLEESLSRLECQNERKLRETLRAMWDSLPGQTTYLGSEELHNAAYRRATIFLAVGLRLLGEEIEVGDEELNAAVSVEVQRIMEAEVVVKPEWLGEPDSFFLALDYGRFKPRGLYTRTEELGRYFRTLKWLQAIPFRLKKEEEMVSIMLLHGALNRANGGYSYGSSVRYRFPDLSGFIGPADGWDVLSAPVFQKKASLAYWIDDEEKSAKDVYGTSGRKEREINDQIRFLPAGEGTGSEIHYRVISAQQTPDAIMFQRISKVTLHNPPVLAIPAVLGCRWAEDQISRRDGNAVVGIIGKCKQLFGSENIYGCYLDCLRHLVSVPEPDAPRFMNQDGWRLKSTNSVLSGYALLKHATMLHAKESVVYGCATRMPPGFVEPNPDFWGGLADVCSKSLKWLDEQAAFKIDVDHAVEELSAAKVNLGSSSYVKCVLDYGQGFNPTDGRFDRPVLLEKYPGLSLKQIRNAILFRNLGRHALWGLKAKDMSDMKDSLRCLADTLRYRVQVGFYSVDDFLRGNLESVYPDYSEDWTELIHICRYLEMLSHKQLRRRQFSKNEIHFLMSFGGKIGNIMQYKGNSYVQPRDDAPRLVEVSYNPNANLYLNIGHCRPRALYVLYPYEGTEVLARGVILPFYEFEDKKRYDDKEWKNMLDSEERPEVPDWIRPIVTKKGLQKPSLGLE